MIGGHKMFSFYRENNLSNNSKPRTQKVDSCTFQIMYADYGGGDGSFNITRQVLPGEFEAVPQNCSIIVHYKIQVDVLDSQYSLVASRQRAKQINITFTGMRPTSDLEEIADSLIGQSELLPESKRPELLKALNDLRNSCGPKGSSSHDSFTKRDKPSKSKDTPLTNSESAPQLALTLSKAEVDNLLHDALQKIHWGNDAECLKTLKQLVDISQYDRNLTLIIQHEPLMNTLINKLKTFASSNLHACICIIGIFEKMSYFSNYQEVIAKFKIGAMSLSLLHAQDKLATVAAKNLDKQKMAAYLQTQNQLLKLIVSLLFNLAENPSAMRKMVNKSIADVLTHLLSRKNADVIVMSMKFLRRIANVPVTWGDINYEDVIEMLAKHVLLWKLDGQEGRTKTVMVLREGIELLYCFSFHQETLEEIKKWKIFDLLAPMVKMSEVRGQMIKFFYKCSTYEGSDEAFRNEELLNMLIAATTTKCDERMIALTILSKISVDKQCAETIAKSSVFTVENLRGMFVQATERPSQENRILLKMIRNVADNQPKLIDGFDQEIVQACLNNSSNMDTLCDIFAISSRAKMTSARAKFFTGIKEFVALIVSVLSNRRALAQLQLECLMFVSSVVLYSEPAKNLGSQIVDRVVDVFLWNPDDLDIQVQCLFAFYRFICHSDSRNRLIGHKEIVDTVIQHSASRNAVVSSISNSVLDSLVTFDQEWKEKIKRPRYMAFNQEWIRAIQGK